MYTLGIDVHKHTSTLVLIDDAYQPVFERTIRSHPDDFNHHLQELPVPPSDLRAALEPVGPWRWIATLLRDNNVAVHVAHPRKVRLIAESTKKRDQHDALTLASLLQSGYLPEARFVPDDIYELRLLLRERLHVVRMRVATINRLHGIATTQGLHRLASRKPTTKAGKASILSGNNQTLQALHSLIGELDQRIAVFDRECARVARSLPEAKRLMTIPAVGVVTALTVVAEVGAFADFATPRKLVAYAGLAPKERSSGSVRRGGSITRTGSPYLRTALVETAMRIHPKSAPELYAFVERLKPRVGAKKARVALARKLLVLMWHLVKDRTTYDRTRAFPASLGDTTLSAPDTVVGT